MRIGKSIFFLLFIFSHAGFSQTITRVESVQSLYVQIFKDSVLLGNATGFVIKSKTRNYLITNWHVVTNKDPRTRDWIKDHPKISPNRIEIVHNSKNLGEYKSVYESLVDKSGKAKFVEFPLRRGSREMIDVAAIPLSDTTEITIYPVKYTDELDSLVLQPTDRLFVLGFPKGLRSAPFMPIWKSGLIASEPDIDQEGKPIVWLDIEAFPGMSGSPVYLITDKLNYKNGSSAQIIGGSKSFFTGVFSHDKGSNVGAVWKSWHLKELFSYLE